MSANFFKVGKRKRCKDQPHQLLLPVPIAAYFFSKRSNTSSAGTPVPLTIRLNRSSKFRELEGL